MRLVDVEPMLNACNAVASRSCEAGGCTLSLTGSIVFTLEYILKDLDLNCQVSFVTQSHIAGLDISQIFLTPDPGGCQHGKMSSALVQQREPAKDEAHQEK